MSTSTRSALLGVTVLAASLAPAMAATLSITGGYPDVFTAETGQSVPTATAGFVSAPSGNPAVLSLDTPSWMTFTYGPPPPIGVAGGTGHGDASNLNEFWVGTSRTAAEALGHSFCTLPIPGVCSAAVVGQSFSLLAPSGLVPFGFSYNQADAGGFLLTNGTSDNAHGAYILANQVAGQSAFIGLADRTYPALDSDFQDMSVLAQIPEPASAALLALGLSGLWLQRRRQG